MNGWKFLNPYGATVHFGTETLYPLPRPGEKWGPWFEHPEPVTDGQDCGPGRYHVMRRLDARYAPANWWPWYAQAEGLAGESAEKYGCHRLRLRRVTCRVFWRIIRLGWCHSSNLSGADLSRANLSRADLDGANLDGADLSGADLYRADLYRADLSGANLDGANLAGADLYRANLSRANLSRADLSGANLDGANLDGAINVPKKTRGQP